MKASSMKWVVTTMVIPPLRKSGDAASGLTDYHTDTGHGEQANALLLHVSRLLSA
jgi:hypothetical protein